MKTIFKNIHNKIKLKIIKYNKYMIRRLDIKKEDFKIYETLKEFNEKLKLNIIDIDIKELDLSWNKISDIKVLENVNFKVLKELNLSSNKISDIKVLEKVKFDKLEELDLYNNNISDIQSIISKLEIKEKIFY